MTTVTGIVEILNEKPTATGGTVYNVKVNGQWFGHGFQKPIFTKGDNVSFEFTQKGNFTNIVPRTVQLVSGQAPQQSAPKAAGGSSSGGSRQNDTQLAIQFQSSRNSAIALFTALVSADAIKLPAKQGDKYDAAVAIVDDLTNQFHVKTTKVVENGGVFLEELEQAMGTPNEDF